MTATAQFFTDCPGLKCKLRLQSIENTGFSYAGISSKGACLSGNDIPQRIDALASLGADPQGVGNSVDLSPMVAHISINNKKINF